MSKERGEAVSDKNGNDSRRSSAPYEKLLKGEISSKQYVKELRKSVRADRRTHDQRSARRSGSAP